MATTKPYTPPYGQYQGTELHRNPGMPAARTAAFDLPSRVGPRLHYPDGTVKPFPSDSIHSHPIPASKGSA